MRFNVQLTMTLEASDQQTAIEQVKTWLHDMSKSVDNFPPAMTAVEVNESIWGCEGRLKLAKARGALSDIADLSNETTGSVLQDLETAVDIARTALEATAQPTRCQLTSEKGH